MPRTKDWKSHHQIELDSFDLITLFQDIKLLLFVQMEDNELNLNLGYYTLN